MQRDVEPIGIGVRASVDHEIPPLPGLEVRVGDVQRCGHEHEVGDLFARAVEPYRQHLGRLRKLLVREPGRHVREPPEVGVDVA